MAASTLRGAPTSVALQASEGQPTREPRALGLLGLSPKTNWRGKPHRCNVRPTQVPFSRLSPPSWLRCSRGFAPKVRRPISSAVGRQFAGPENLETYFQASSAWRPLTGSSSTQPHRHPLAYRRLPLVASRFIRYSVFDFFPRPRFPGSGGGCTL